MGNTIFGGKSLYRQDKGLTGHFCGISQRRKGSAMIQIGDEVIFASRRWEVHEVYPHEGKAWLDRWEGGERARTLAPIDAIRRPLFGRSGLSRVFWMTVSLAGAVLALVVVL